ncbi:hypothetical protein CC99x_009255 [Candidatus Berkiella cookevillensis]|uniref:Uncharacterized protein n=1 Tax=Candidatus Berkiella cookevillensis TaxID=437022 RepID=A0A0Q9YM68_9GAMM|nr:hypothetical protein [Candidatus Berkiella cookevillensis]MCS5709090.1 hypothetical protein [Candidatus Berkiella cookevillensis]
MKRGPSLTQLEIQPRSKKQRIEINQPALSYQQKLYDLTAMLFEYNDRYCTEIIKKLEALMNEAELIALDFNVVIQEGYYSGSSILQIITIASCKDHYSILRQLLEQVPSLLNFRDKAESGINQGKNALWLFAEEMNRVDLFEQEHLALFELMLSSQVIASQDLNVKCEKGTDAGKTPLWLLGQLMWKNPQFIKAAIDHSSITTLDLNAGASEGFYKGRTILHFIAELAYQKPDFILSIIQNGLHHTLDFNAKIQGNSCHKGKTPLFFIIDAVVKKHPSLLQTLIQEIPTQLDFNAKIEAEEDFQNGETAFACITRAALEKQENGLLLLEQILKDIPLKNLDFNAKREGKWHKGKTPLWDIAALAKVHPFPLLTVLLGVSSDKLEFNIKEEDTATEKGKTVLWHIVEAALEGYPEVLNTLIDNFPIEILDFNAKADTETQKNVSIRHILQNSSLSPLLSKIDFLTSLAQIGVLWNEMDLQGDAEQNRVKLFETQFKEQLEQLEMFADNAQKENHENAYYFLAVFYEEIGLGDRLKNIASRVPAENPYRDEIYYRLSHSTIYGMQNVSSIARQIKDPKEHKKTLLEGLGYALEMQESNELRKNIAFNLVYGLDSPSSGLPTQALNDEPLLNNLGGGKNTCLFAIKTLRSKVKLKQKLEAKTQEAQVLQGKISELTLVLQRQEEQLKDQTLRLHETVPSNETLEKKMQEMEARMASRIQKMVEQAVEERTTVLQAQLQAKCEEVEDYKVKILQLEAQLAKRSAVRGCTIL